VTDPVTDQASPTGDRLRYRERLRTPWWWYLVSFAVAILLSAEFAAAVPGWVAWTPFALLIPTCILVVWRLSSGTVRVTDHTLDVGERALELAEVEQAIALSPTELRRLIGRHSDPLAYDFVRSWVGPGIQFVLRELPRIEVEGVDYSDPDVALPPRREPYWLISTRHPDRVLAAVHEAMSAR
jgi:hypothetical protein